MSRFHQNQRVLRAVRLLPQAVKIGIEAEPALPPEKEEEQRSHELLKETETTETDRSGADSQAASSSPDSELLQELENLRQKVAELEAKNAELDEARREAEAQIDGAKTEYEEKRRVLDEEVEGRAAAAEAEARKKGRDEGWQTGHEEGLTQARTEVEAEYLERFSSLVAFIDELGKKLDASFNDLVALNEPHMLRLWFSMLGRMLRREVSLKPDVVRHVLADVLSRVSEKNQVAIYVAPEDLALLDGKMDREFQEVLRGVRRLELKADANVDPGSCIVETGLGIYDARWR